MQKSVFLASMFTGKGYSPMAFGQQNLLQLGIIIARTKNTEVDYTQILSTILEICVTKPGDGMVDANLLMLIVRAQVIIVRLPSPCTVSVPWEGIGVTWLTNTAFKKEDLALTRLEVARLEKFSKNVGALRMVLESLTRKMMGLR